MWRLWPRSTIVQSDLSAPTRSCATSSIGFCVADSPTRCRRRPQTWSRRSSESARCAPRRDSRTAWISSTMTTRAVFSISRERSAVRSRYSDSGVVTRMWGGERIARACRRGDQSVLARADRAPALELRLGGRQRLGAAGNAETRFPPALEDGMEVLGKHEFSVKYTPNRKPGQRLCLFRAASGIWKVFLNESTILTPWAHLKQPLPRGSAPAFLLRLSPPTGRHWFARSRSGPSLNPYPESGSRR